MSHSEQEKIRILLPHWLEHNQSHKAEFEKWAEVARQEELPEVAELISRAARQIDEVNALLDQALAKAGGPVEGHSHHHHHH